MDRLPPWIKGPFAGNKARIRGLSLERDFTIGSEAEKHAKFFWCPTCDKPKPRDEFRVTRIENGLFYEKRCLACENAKKLVRELREPGIFGECPHKRKDKKDDE